jgi:F420-dependent oxidoreductase-like protein
MQTSIGVADFVSSHSPGFTEVADYVVEAERLGVDTVWSAEAWGTDAVVPLAYLAARTSRIRLGAGVMQITARTPSMTAMTAMTLDHVSAGRFILGLGVSGPQVVEGLHGVPYARPLERLRETFEVIRLALAGERVAYAGNQIHLPRPGGEGKALRIGQPAHPDIPIHLATLGPRSLELTGAIADGWVGTSFVPEGAAYYVDRLRAGAEAAGRDFGTLELDAGGPVAFTDDIERLVGARKKALAFQLGAMGSAESNFYNDAFSRIGWADTAQRVQELWMAGEHADAVAAVPDELAIGTSLFGAETMVADRIRAYRDAGVTSLRLDPMGRSVSERLDTLGWAVELVREVSSPQ